MSIQDNPFEVLPQTSRDSHSNQPSFQLQLGAAVITSIGSIAIWLVAFIYYNFQFQKNPLQAYDEQNEILLVAVIFQGSFSLLVCWICGLRFGRPICGLILACAIVTLFFPRVSASNRTRIAAIARDQYYGFREKTIGFAVFSIPIATAIIVALRNPEGSEARRGSRLK